MTKLNKQYLCVVNEKNHCWFMHHGSPRTITWNQKPKLFQCTASDRSSWQWWKTLRRKQQLKQKLIYFIMSLLVFFPQRAAEIALKIKWWDMSEGCNTHNNANLGRTSQEKLPWTPRFSNHFSQEVAQRITNQEAQCRTQGGWSHEPIS